MLKIRAYLKNIFLCACLCLIGYNSYQLVQKLTPDRPVQFPGIQFAGLTEKLQGQSHISYLTDTDLNDPSALALYVQAQFVLAPIILDVRDTHHLYILMNYSNDLAAFNKLKELNAKPLLRNPFGVILAMRQPNGTNNPNQETTNP